MNCSKCSKNFIGQGVTESQLAKALGLTLCSECWFVLEYGNDQTPITKVATLGEDGKLASSQVPEGVGGQPIGFTILANDTLAQALATNINTQITVTAAMTA